MVTFDMLGKALMRARRVHYFDGLCSHQVPVMVKRRLLLDSAAVLICDLRPDSGRCWRTACSPAFGKLQIICERIEHLNANRLVSDPVIPKPVECFLRYAAGLSGTSRRWLFQQD